MEVKDIISSGLLEMYVAGITTAQETMQVQQWILQYPEVSAELAEIELAIESYAALLAEKPAPSVKDRIFAGIKNSEPAKVVPLTSNENKTRQDNAVKISSYAYWKNAAAAAVILLLGSVALNLFFYTKNQTAGKELALAQQELGGLKDKAKAMEDDMQVVHSKYSKPVSLDGMEAAPDAAAKIFWMKNTGEVFIDPGNLPETPKGMQYQLWAFVDGKPVDAGLILTSKNGNKYRIQKMKTFGKAEAFAVTLEVAAEKPATEPHGQIYVMGKM